MPRLRISAIRVLLFTLSVVFLASPAYAQRSRGSESDLLRRDEVRGELSLTDEQSTKLEELKKSSTPGKELFDPYLKRIAETKDKEEQTKIREEMSAAVKKQRKAFEEQAVSVLNDSQKKKLRGIFIRSAGTRALADPTVAKDYELTEEQLKKIATLGEERRTASRALGFNASEEDRTKFTEEWHGKFMAVLTPKQKARYEKESTYGEEAEVAEATTEKTEKADAPPEMKQPSGPVVISFGGDSESGETKLTEKFSFNFRGAPWDQVLQMYADGAGLTLELAQTPPGTFSHIDSNEYGPKKTLDILNGNLLRKGYTVIENDGFLIVLNVDNGIPAYLIPNVEIDELLKIGDELAVGDHQLVNVTMPVEGMDTGRAAQEVEPMIGPHGSMIALTESRLLIMTDTGGSLRRIHSLLAVAMSQSKPDALLFKSYHLKHIDAEEAEIQVMTQFGMRQNVANVSYGVETQSRFQSRSRTQTPTPQRTPATPAKTGPQLQVASDLRLNSLLVTGTATQHKLVEEIVKSLDVGEGPDGQQLTRGKRGTYLEVYQVKSADAGEVTKTLSAMNLPGVTVVNEDRRTGRIHIMATERQHQEVASLIRQLDGGGSSGSVAVIPLAQMDPLSAAATLRSLFYADGDDAPTIETDLYGRRLIVRGDIDQITQIKQVLADLGEDGTGVRQRGDGGTVRRFSLQGRNPDDFVKILKQAWDAQEVQKINIVVPVQPGPIRNRQSTNELEESVQEEKPPGDNLSQYRPQRQSPASQWKQWRQPVERNKVTSSTTGQRSDFIKVRSPQDGAAAGASKEVSKGDDTAQATGKGDEKLDVIVYGDELILSSPDESQLDRLEDLMDQLHQSMPFKPEYTVVYLKSADALEAADMLSQFFPSSSVATTSTATGGSMLGGLTSGLSSMGSNLMDMTGLSGLGSSSQSLRIIPDPRTNSLFMTGPQTMITDAIEFLNVLDSNDIPESLKDMQPHFINVKYADIVDVEEHVKNVFKIYTEAQGGGKQQQQNPLAAMFGGGGRSNDPSQQIRMLVDSNEQTSTLTVYCNQNLFEEVEAVVKKMDEDTRLAKPGIRVIQLKHADATLIQQSLTNLIPRVSVTSSRTNRSSTNSSGNTSGSSGNPQQDAINKAIQDRMRQQFSGGAQPGGGRTGAGSRTGAGGFGGRGFGGTGRGTGGGFGGRRGGR